MRDRKGDAAELICRDCPPAIGKKRAVGLVPAVCAPLSPGVRYVTDDRCPRCLDEDGFCLLDSPGREFRADRKPQCGAVSFIQRFDSALRLPPYSHGVLRWDLRRR